MSNAMPLTAVFGMASSAGLKNSLSGIFTSVPSNERLTSPACTPICSIPPNSFCLNAYCPAICVFWKSPMLSVKSITPTPCSLPPN
ncbi:hypothetical protein Barb7_02998 [Bacteroidales bacterium Barb7]|nr:hypothetical protein Barb7_02998 [Bacteroidales bacterium Barb7]